jgi:hypothetical protein
MQRVDWRDYVPSRPSMTSSAAIEPTSLVLGLAIGIGVGIALGYAMKDNVTPAMRRAREKAKVAAGRIEEHLPARLRVTRMEESAVTQAP